MCSRIDSLLGLLMLFSTGYAIRLNPSVFKHLESLPLPPVQNDFGISFNFTTTRDRLVSTQVQNATFETRIDQFDTAITLFIPLSEVNMRGFYTNHVRVPLPDGYVISQNSTGRYKLTMRDVHLTFVFVINFTLNGVIPTLTECHPIIGEVDMALTEFKQSRGPLSVPTLSKLVSTVSRENYKQMFCNAMTGLTADFESPIIASLLNRIDAAFS